MTVLALCQTCTNLALCTGAGAQLVFTQHSNSMPCWCNSLGEGLAAAGVFASLEPKQEPKWAEPAWTPLPQRGTGAGSLLSGIVDYVLAGASLGV